MLGGWSSNSKYALLGGLRVTAQTVSYEVFMGIALMGIVMIAGSFNLRDIVVDQAAHGWYIVPQFFGFCTFVLAAIAEIGRAHVELQSLIRISYAVFCLRQNTLCSKSQTTNTTTNTTNTKSGETEN